jgi:hypothetical protein
MIFLKRFTWVHVFTFTRSQDNNPISYKLEGIVIGNRQELKGKTIDCKRYKTKEGLLEGCRWQSKPLKNLHAWGRRDNNGRNIYKPPRQYIRVLKVL